MLQYDISNNMNNLFLFSPETCFWNGKERNRSNNKKGILTRSTVVLYWPSIHEFSFSFRAEFAARDFARGVIHVAHQRAAAILPHCTLGTFEESWPTEGHQEGAAHENSFHRFLRIILTTCFQFVLLFFVCFLSFNKSTLFIGLQLYSFTYFHFRSPLFSDEFGITRPVL